MKNFLTPQRFQRWTYITLLLVFFLILVGGIVRTTGSGLGCPDWPKCFGQWVPPTDISQLPEDYQTRFSIAGKSIAEFDAFKTWTEYINRLIGVLIGFSIMIMLFLSYAYLGRSRILIWGSWLSFFLVSFQGWVGAVVVKSHLAAYMVTIHMFLALLLVCLILALLRWSQFIEKQACTLIRGDSRLRWVVIILFVLTLVQVFFGTQLREAIDMVIKSRPEIERSLWVSETGLIFLIHRSFSILLVLGQGYLTYLFLAQKNERALRIVSGAFLLSLFSGIGLAYFDFPSFLQPIHLLFTLILATCYFDLFLKIPNSAFNSNIK